MTEEKNHSGPKDVDRKFPKRHLQEEDLDRQLAMIEAALVEAVRSNPPDLSSLIDQVKKIGPKS